MNADLSVRSLGIECAGDIVQLNVAEGIANRRRTAANGRAPHAPIACRAVHAPLNVSERDIAEAVVYVRTARNRGNIDIPVVVANDEISVDIADIHATERVGNASRTSVSQLDGTITVDDGS